MELYDVERLRKMAYAALFAALTGAGAVVAIPIGPVPITLQTFFIMLAGFVLGAKWGGISILLYLLLGAAGLPVFSGGQGGAGHLLGPTAGFLWGFPVGAFVVGVFAQMGDGRGGAQRLAFKLAGAVAGSAVIYVFGTIGLMQFFGMGVYQALLIGTIPFLPVTAFEIAAAVGLSEKLNRSDVASASSGPEVRGRDERAVYGGLLGFAAAFASIIPWAYLDTVVDDNELEGFVRGVTPEGRVDLVHEEDVVDPVAVEVAGLLPYGLATAALGLAAVVVAVLVARGFDERKAAAAYGAAGVASVAVAAAGYLEVASWSLDVSVSVGYGVYLAALAGLALAAFAGYSYREAVDDRSTAESS